MQVHSEPFYYFLLIAPAHAALTLFAPRAIRNVKIAGLKNMDPFSKYLLVWAAVVILFFSAGSGKLMGI